MNKKDRKQWTQKMLAGLLLVLTLIMVQPTPVLHAQAPEPEQKIAPLATLTLRPIDDASLQEAHPNTNFGAASTEELLLGRIDGGRARALVQFNIDKVPTGATLTRATFRIYQHGWYDYAGSHRTITASRVTSAWHEAVATWAYAPTTGESVGSVSAGMSTSWYEIDVTALAQAWYAGILPNYGLMLRGYEGSGNTYRLFTPRMYMNDPELIIEYTLNPMALVTSTNTARFLTDGAKLYPDPFTLEIDNSGSGVMGWAINTGSIPWLDVSPTSGTNSALNTIPVDITVLTPTLPPGDQTVPITITASGAQGSPKVVQIIVVQNSTPFTTVYLPLITKNFSGNSTINSNPQTIALLMGIADYQYLGPRPSSSVRTGDWGYDLQEINQNPDHLRRVLTAFGEVTHTNIRTLKDAEAAKDAIAQGFEWVSDRDEKINSQGAPVGKLSATQGKIVIGYGGHGGEDTFGAHWITAYDTNEAGGTFTNALSGSDLDTYLDGLDSSQILVLIDACYSGGLLPSLQQPGRVILTATDADHSAWESSALNGGVFTYFFVQALHDPAADTNGDSWISAEEAYTYAAGRTNAYTQSHIGSSVVQNPQIIDGVSGQLLLTQPTGTTLVAFQPTVQSPSISTAGLPILSFAGESIRRPVVMTPLQ